MDKRKLRDLYVDEGKSMMEIAAALGCSLHKVAYWMNKYGLKRRSRSEAIYLRCNPGGDPFKFRRPKGAHEAELFGMGLGLYWGEGTKASLDSVRLGNTDPKLISAFMYFLVTFFGIDRRDLRFGLQVFSDMNSSLVLDFWVKKLKIGKEQFYKVIVTRSRSLGTYRKKSQFGVLTVMYHNKKMRDLLVGLLPK